MSSHYISSRSKAKYNDGWNYYTHHDYFAKLELDKRKNREELEAATEKFLAESGKTIESTKRRQRGERVYKKVDREQYQSKDTIVRERVSALDYAAGVAESKGIVRRNIFDMLG